MEYTLFTDGGSRGNPGPAGSGAVLLNPDGVECAVAKRYLGTATNNVAEYMAIIIGLQMARDHGVTDLTVCMDSELAVKQLNGAYRVKNEALARLFLEVKELVRAFHRVTFKHVRRERNTRADELVNNAIDEAGFAR